MRKYSRANDSKTWEHGIKIKVIQAQQQMTGKRIELRVQPFRRKSYFKKVKAESPGEWKVSIFPVVFIIILRNDFYLPVKIYLN